MSRAAGAPGCRLAAPRARRVSPVSPLHALRRVSRPRVSSVATRVCTLSPGLRPRVSSLQCLIHVRWLS